MHPISVETTPTAIPPKRKPTSVATSRAVFGDRVTGTCGTSRIWSCKSTGSGSWCPAGCPLSQNITSTQSLAGFLEEHLCNERMNATHELSCIYCASGSYNKPVEAHGDQSRSASSRNYSECSHSQHKRHEQMTIPSSRACTYHIGHGIVFPTPSGSLSCAGFSVKDVVRDSPGLLPIIIVNFPGSTCNIMGNAHPIWHSTIQMGSREMWMSTYQSTSVLMSGQQYPHSQYATKAKDTCPFLWSEKSISHR